MAVYAAHLTRTLQGTPSVFQVTAQESLGSTVKPALRKVFEFLAHAYPSRCGWCVDFFDELYLLFDSLLQYHYLKHYAASFSESFYGLLRVPIAINQEFNLGQRLPAALEWGSLVLLVVVPYLKDRVERIVDQWREDYEDGRWGKTTSHTLRLAAIRLHSTVHLVTSCAKVYYLATYLTGRSQSHTPELALLGLTLKNAPAKDESVTWGEVLKSLYSGNVGSTPLSFPLLGGLLLRSVEYGAFAVQLLSWWESRVGVETGAAPSSLPEKDARAERLTNKCPICLQTWKIPTVLPVSGYVFCYTCISRHLRLNQACPITRCPAAEHTLVRMYIN